MREGTKDIPPYNSAPSTSTEIAEDNVRPTRKTYSTQTLPGDTRQCRKRIEQLDLPLSNEFFQALDHP
jgi:hypothetical protein